MKPDINEKINIPEKVEIIIDNGLVKVKGPKGEIVKRLFDPKIKMDIQDNKILIESKKTTKREKRLIGTIKAHIKNMIKGVNESFIYRLKICSTHFPMTVSVNNDEISVNNFLGENVPRTVKIKKGVNVKIEGNIITVESPDKELAGQTAASIELLCRITKRDRRIFQDGIYITEKAGKEIK